MKRKIVLLLTACINPNGMANTALIDNEERKNQYYNALNFYLSTINIPIVFVENSNYDISNDYKKEIQSGSLEFITFNGNDFEKFRGKGYGEALIIKEGFQKSYYLNHCHYVVKITGRIIVQDIKRIISSKLLYFDNIFRCDFRLGDFLWSMVFVAKASTLQEIITNKIEQIDESKWVLFEHVLYCGMYESKKTIAIPFIEPPIIEGISGSWNVPYSDIINKDRVNLNIQLTPFFYKRANRPFAYAISRLVRFFYNRFKR